jgi:hypothetical protein
LLVAARRLRDAADPLGARLRARLAAPTGLSPEAIELALERSLEVEPDPRELRALLASVEPTSRAHVFLPSNVFVAAHRALALALASSADVRVKPSRREPVFVELLAEAAPGLFEIVPGSGEYPWQEVRAGDHVWAYASDQTLSTLSTKLPAGAVLHAHGAGFGVAVVALGDRSLWLESARGLALDTSLFEQRGCLSPRLVLAQGDIAAAEAFAELLARALSEFAEQCPAGRFEPGEQAASAWFRQRSAALGRVFAAAGGAVAVHATASLLVALPPSGRNLLVVPLDAEELARALAELAPHITIAGCSSPDLARHIERALPRARIAPLGRMQSPPFDGPADLRNR